MISQTLIFLNGKNFLICIYFSIAEVGSHHKYLNAASSFSPHDLFFHEVFLRNFESALCIAKTLARHPVEPCGVQG